MKKEYKQPMIEEVEMQSLWDALQSPIPVFPSGEGSDGWDAE